MMQVLSMRGLSEREAQARRVAGRRNAAPPPTSRARRVVPADGKAELLMERCALCGAPSKQPLIKFLGRETYHLSSVAHTCACCIKLGDWRFVVRFMDSQRETRGERMR